MLSFCQAGSTRIDSPGSRIPFKFEEVPEALCESILRESGNAEKEQAPVAKVLSAPAEVPSELVPTTRKW
jgi:hypothetical protein